MAVSFLPEGYQQVIPYLLVDDVDGLIHFLGAVFHGERIERMLRPDGRVMHAEVRIGEAVVMMGTPIGNVSTMPTMIYIFDKDVDAAYERAITNGAESIQPPTDQFYGHRTAGVKDKAGNIWWIATQKEIVSNEEMARRIITENKESK